MMKQTPFTAIHEALSARMINFSGYRMPLEYKGVRHEHQQVRQHVGVFDVSHMGEIWVKGLNASEFLQLVTTNDISRLSEGMAQYTCLPNGKGGIVDDLLVYCYEAQKYLLVVNAANVAKDFEWLQKHNTFEVELENASDRMAQLAIQGPKAKALLQKITTIDLDALSPFHFTTGPVADALEVIISETGYTGAGGYELYMYNEDGENIWQAIFDAGKEFGVEPVGLAARDTLRLEMGYCLYGNDIDDMTSPIEAGLSWICKFTDNNPFLDRDLLWQQKQEGVGRLLRGFEMLERGIPRQAYDIVDHQGEKIGNVTSGTMSPSLNKGIGMGYIRKDFSKLGQEIYVAIRNKRVKARVVKLPFYKD